MTLQKKNLFLFYVDGRGQKVVSVCFYLDMDAHVINIFILLKLDVFCQTVINYNLHYCINILQSYVMNCFIVIKTYSIVLACTLSVKITFPAAFSCFVHAA